jgi:Domain of unknown function DUF123
MVAQKRVTSTIRRWLERHGRIRELPAGNHAYQTGKSRDWSVGNIQFSAARRNLEARISRHLRREKRLRWHIDYLLAAPEAVVTGVERFAQAECELNSNTTGEVVVAGFGASDCRAGCGSHLKYIEARCELG